MREPNAARGARDDLSYQFGPFRFEKNELLLYRGEQEVALPPRALRVLSILLERAGGIVAKEELLEAVWPGMWVGENSLSEVIKPPPQGIRRRTAPAEVHPDGTPSGVSLRGRRHPPTVRGRPRWRLERRDFRTASRRPPEADLGWDSQSSPVSGGRLPRRDRWMRGSLVDRRSASFPSWSSPKSFSSRASDLGRS